MRPIDVVLLDLEMADCTGLTLLADFFHPCRDNSCIHHCEHAHGTAVDRAGLEGWCTWLCGEGFLPKKSSWPSSRLSKKIPFTKRGPGLCGKCRACPANGKEIHRALSNRELEIFLQIAQGKSLKAISLDLNLSAKTVSVHKHNIWKKTGIDLEHALLATASRTACWPPITRLPSPAKARPSARKNPVSRETGFLLLGVAQRGARSHDRAPALP